VRSLLRIKIAELPKEKAFGEFGFFVVLFWEGDSRVVLYPGANKKRVSYK
jgi:hypothetical protein